MALGGKALFRVDYSKFNISLDVVMTKVGRATRKATVDACEQILKESLKQVPRETTTLASSAYYEVHGNYKEGFYGIIGYGGNGDPINPKTGQRASEYMVVVHEDLMARHPIGKAKFLEDPVRSYQSNLNKRFKHFIRLEGTGMR